MGTVERKDLMNSHLRQIPHRFPSSLLSAFTSLSSTNPGTCSFTDSWIDQTEINRCLLGKYDLFSWKKGSSFLKIKMYLAAMACRRAGVEGGRVALVRNGSVAADATAAFGLRSINKDGMSRRGRG